MRCFSSPGLLRVPMDSGPDDPKGPGFPIRKSADQSLLTAPHGLSQRATSFIASRCQGIHQMPLLHLIPTARPAQGRTPWKGEHPRHEKPEPSGLTSRIIKTRTANDPGAKAARQRQEPPKRLLPRPATRSPRPGCPNFFARSTIRKSRFQKTGIRDQNQNPDTCCLIPVA